MLGYIVMGRCLVGRGEPSGCFGPQSHLLLSSSENRSASQLATYLSRVLISSLQPGHSSFKPIPTISSSMVVDGPAHGKLCSAVGLESSNKSSQCEQLVDDEWWWYIDPPRAKGSPCLQAPYYRFWSSRSLDIHSIHSLNSMSPAVKDMFTTKHSVARLVTAILAKWIDLRIDLRYHSTCGVLDHRW